MHDEASSAWFDAVGEHDAEHVAVFADPESGLRAIVAIHSTVLGPSLGGTRFRPYPTEHAALVDVLRLAKGMTYKHAVCGNDNGGGKAVIVGEPSALRSEALWTAYARALDALGGRYLTAEDVGTTQADMDALRARTRFVTGASPELGGSGDPSPATAFGVVCAMRAVAGRLWGDASLEGRRVVVSGVGKVGAAVARHVVEAGGEVVLADVRPEPVGALLDELGPGRAQAVDPPAAHATECDIFSPNALGAVLDACTIPQLRCAAVCGAANNQLATDEDGDRLAAAGVLYAPDFVVNAGGVINIADETAPGGYDHDRAFARVAKIESTLGAILEQAAREGISPSAAADAVAEARLAAVKSRARP